MKAMTEIFTFANSYEALPKIFEIDEESFEDKKTRRDGNISSKNLRAKRRKENAKEKNCRRELGTRYAKNPYRGKPGDYRHQHHLHERYGKFEKIEKDRRKAFEIDSIELETTCEAVELI